MRTLPAWFHPGQRARLYAAVSREAALRILDHRLAAVNDVLAKECAREDVELGMVAAVLHHRDDLLEDRLRLATPARVE